MARKPLEIKRMESNGISITWNDNTHCVLNSSVLRLNCPCAECRENRGDSSHSAPLTPKKANPLKVISASVEEETSIEAIWPIGNYALGMRWADGHQTGIYTYQLLEQLAGL